MRRNREGKVVSSGGGGQQAFLFLPEDLRRICLFPQKTPPSCLLYNLVSPKMAAGQQARAAFQKVFQRISEQARQSASGGGPGGSGGPTGKGPNMNGLLGGGAGLFLLIGGGIAINSSLFNGA